MCKQVLGRAGIAASVVFCSALFSSAAFAQPETVTIGVIAPTSGPVATVAIRQLRTVEWWQKDVEANGGINGRSIKFVHCNDEGRPEKAVVCARELVSQKVALILNMSLSGPIKATIPVLRQGPVMLTPSPYIEPDPAGYVFQTTPTDRDMTAALAAYLRDNGVSRLGMIAATDSSGESSVANAREIFPASGIDVNIARIDLRANDASVQIATVARDDVPTIYSAYSGAGQAIVVKSFQSLGIGKPLIVSNANVSDAFLTLIEGVKPDRMLGIAIRGVDPDLVTGDKARARLDSFLTSYQAWAGERPDHLNLLALTLIDAATAILQNVENVQDHAAAKHFLETTPIESFQTLRFTPQRHIGMNEEDVAVLELKNDRWKKADAF